MISRYSLREIVRIKDELQELAKRLYETESESALASDIRKIGDALWEVSHRHFAYPLVEELREELRTSVVR